MKGLGNRIQTLRKDRHITLVELAQKTGIDQATLSRIENEKMTGTLESHMRLADALGLRLPQLYEDLVKKSEEARDKIAKKKMESFSHTSGVMAELLTGGALQKKMLPVLLKLKPQGRTETEVYPAFTERFIYVTAGTIEVTLDKNKKELKTGESLYFNGSQPHHFRNLSKTGSRCLSIMTPVSLKT